jgi:hypothetical protein
MRRLVPGLLVAWLAAPVSAQETYLLIVTGISGEPKYGDAFHEWATQLESAAEKRMGLPRAHIIYLGEKPDRDPSRIDGRSTREGVSEALRKIGAGVRPGDTVAVVLFGHGSASGGVALFNLPGPDLSASDFAKLLEPFALQRVVFVNTASASGDFQRALQGKNRVIVTATKSGMERNETVFGRYFAEALAKDVADVDKNGRVSIQEAFDYARQQVAEAYQKDNRLLTEHAVLDDGQGGALARTAYLGGDGAQTAEATPSDPRLAALVRERQALEDRIEALKARKDTLAADAYEKELESLLLELAAKSEEIQKARGAR